MRRQYLKQIKNLFFIFATFAIISCGKDGTIGPEGQKGDKGEQGVKGVDGSTVHSGSGAPVLTLGQVGDFYLDKATTNLYGPKTVASWGEPLTLKGAKGDAGENGSNGTDGSKMLSGKGNPASSVGSSGDFYFDTEQIAFYGPKTASSWGTPVSLKAANDNGVKVVIIKNFKAEGTFSSNYGSSFYIETLIKPTVDYNRFYDDGVILVQVRDPKDSRGLWSEDVSRETTLVSSVLSVESYVGTEGLPFGKEGIYLETNFHFFAHDWSIDLETIDLTQYFKRSQDEFLYDIKIVLIPGTQVTAMKQQNINLKDTKAVAKYLNF